MIQFDGTQLKDLGTSPVPFGKVVWHWLANWIERLSVLPLWEVTDL